MNTINPADAEVLSARLGKELRERGLTMATAESCTGGLIAHLLTLVSGSSAYFKGSVVSYCNEVKMSALGVSKASIDAHTEVSGEVAREMAEGAARVMGTDVAVSTTGIAGPTGALPGQPVGTVWIGLSAHGQSSAKSHHFCGTRAEVISQAATMALKTALDAIIGQSDR